MLKAKEANKNTNNTRQLYLSIDHLKPGDYLLNIMLNNKIVKSIELKK